LRIHYRSLSFSSRPSQCWEGGTTIDVATNRRRVNVLFFILSPPITVRTTDGALDAIDGFPPSRRTKIIRLHPTLHSCKSIPSPRRRARIRTLTWPHCNIPR
jgi:hypothetical protein